MVDPLLQFTSSALSKKKPALKKTVGRSLLQPTASALNRKKPALKKRFTFFAIYGTFRQRCVFTGVRCCSSLANRGEFLRHFSDDRIQARCVNDRFCPFSSKVRMVQLLLMMTHFQPKKSYSNFRYSVALSSIQFNAKILWEMHFTSARLTVL